MAKDENKEWVVTTRKRRPLHEIAKDLTEAGLSNVQVLEEIGIITGSATDKVAVKLRKVPGVKTVKPGLRPDVGLPDQKLTW